jgi:hypothetical protein
MKSHVLTLLYNIIIPRIPITLKNVYSFWLEQEKNPAFYLISTIDVKVTVVKYPVGHFEIYKGETFKEAVDA